MTRIHLLAISFLIALPPDASCAGLFKSLPEKLVSDDADDRASALKKLGKMKPEAKSELAPKLIELFESIQQEAHTASEVDRVTTLRSRVTKAMGVIGLSSPETLPFLKNRVSPDCGGACQEAIRTLGDIGAQAAEAVPDLILILEADTQGSHPVVQARIRDARPLALEALAKIGTPEASAAVTRAKHKEEDADAAKAKREAACDDFDRKVKKGQSKWSEDENLLQFQCPSLYGLVSGNLEEYRIEGPLLAGKIGTNLQGGVISVGGDVTSEGPSGAYGLLLDWLLICESTMERKGDKQVCQLVSDMDTRVIDAAKRLVGHRTDYGRYPKLFIDGLKKQNELGNKSAGLFLALISGRESRWDDAITYYNESIEGQSRFIPGASTNVTYWKNQGVKWIEGVIRSRNPAVILADDDTYSSVVLRPKNHAGKTFVFQDLTVLRVYAPGQLDKSDSAFILATLGAPRDERIGKALDTQFTLITGYGFKPDMDEVRRAQATEDKLLLVRVEPKQIEQVERVKPRTRIAVVGSLTGQYKTNLLGQVAPSIKLGHLMEP